MLDEVMIALRVTDMEYAPEICDLLEAAYLDLSIAGVVIEGECSFNITKTTDQQTREVTIEVTDESTITDKLVLQAMKTYVRMHFGSPADYERLAASYKLQREQMANATGYTDFGEGAEENE